MTLPEKSPKIPRTAGFVRPHIESTADSVYRVHDGTGGDTREFQNLRDASQHMWNVKLNNEARLYELWNSDVGALSDTSEESPYLVSLVSSYTLQELEESFKINTFVRDLEKRECGLMRNVSHDAGRRLYTNAINDGSQIRVSIRNMYSQAVFDSAVSLLEGNDASNGDTVDRKDLSSVPLELAVAIADTDKVSRRVHNMWRDVREELEDPTKPTPKNPYAFCLIRGRIVGFDI